MLRARANFKKVVKDATNTFFKNSKYATLGAYIEATEDALTAEDLLVIPKFHVIEGKLYLELIISHPCGESIPSGPYPLNPAKETPDQYGSALSYARRYLLSSMLNLVSEDDDGAGSSGHGKEEKPEQKPEDHGSSINPVQVKMIRKKLEKAGRMVEDFCDHFEIRAELLYDITDDSVVCRGRGGTNRNASGESL